MRTAHTGAVQVHIDAPANKVWELLSHLERMGEWSPECYRVEWDGGATSPATPGARFRGWNRSGRMKWSVACQVKTAVPEKELSFSTVFRGKEGVTWSYRIEPSDGGVDPVESFDVHWLPLSGWIIENYFMPDRDRRREEAMRSTLERIKQVAETG